MTISSPGEPAGTASNNRFAPPASNVSDVGAPTLDSSLSLFGASTTKFVLMSLCTFSVYPLYWFYKNWVTIRLRSGESIMPFWRAFFSGLWAYSCFKHILAIGESKSEWSNEPASGPPIGLLAFLYFVLLATSRLHEPYWMISLFAFLPVLPMNRYVNALNVRRETFVPNDRYSGWNWVGLTFGNALLILAVIGTFLEK